MSCVSLPDCAAPEEQDQFDPAQVSWPELVQGVRVYAVRQPPNVASELLQWADLLDGIAGLRGDGESN